jgi:hypothetical protein
VDYDYDEGRVADLLGNLYLVVSGEPSHRDFQLSSNNSEFDAAGFPDHVVVAIMSRSGEVIDDFDYLAASSWQEGVEFEFSPTDIEQVVLGGESETLEFKREIPKRGEDIAICVTAMANRIGGRILIGVDESAAIIGYTGNKPEETIRSILREYCIPPLEPKVDILQVKDKRVVSITVLGGGDNPYEVRNKGFYIRSGSTNRVLKRYELDLMRQPQSPLRSFQ